MNVLRVHGPLPCEWSCSVCDGEHHWLEECVDDGLREFCADAATLPAEGEPVLVCKHCYVWAEYPEWWDDGAEWSAVDVRENAEGGGGE